MKFPGQAVSADQPRQHSLTLSISRRGMKRSHSHGRSAPHSGSIDPRSEKRRWAYCVVPALLATISMLVGYDWWSVVPSEQVATYVGRQRCIDCHRGAYQAWQGSDHDLAMDHATPTTVLANFNDVRLAYQGVETHFFRRNEQYWVRTEGPDGKPSDFQITFVFGVRPLQQYLVDMDHADPRPSNQVGRLQVLRWSWDTLKKEWFHLDPPDVPPTEKLASTDPLHWTGSAQNWNHMCADCHSTHVQKNFDVATRSYHTQFSELDVSCEACHGPGSVHVELASAWSLFWDRERGIGLTSYTEASAQSEIESCAPCHSRRSLVHAGTASDDSYWDRHDLQLLSPETYYADGQIRDEVYEFGSFLQSKMYHKGIRCTDCHDPHTTRVRFSDNRLCTSCHAHQPSRYDTPAHHHHAIGSAGSQCVACHMPETPFMEIDLRRDHGLRVPRPDLSVSVGTPNACTGCHVGTPQVAGEASLSADKAATLSHYSKWLAARDAGDSEVGDELARTDRWASEWFQRWYGERPRPSHATALSLAWKQSNRAIEPLTSLIEQKETAGIIRASALAALSELAPDAAQKLAVSLVRDSDPLVQVTALRSYQNQLPENWRELIAPRLLDGQRLVRMEAAQLLAAAPAEQLSLEQQSARHRALDEYRQGLQLHSDLAGSHLALGILAERMGRWEEAKQSYRTAMFVQPTVVGPRSNLAALLDQEGNRNEALRWRAEELPLLARDAQLAPQHAATQYRYALALYLQQRVDEAIERMKIACHLEPRDFDYGLALVLLLEHTGRFDEAVAECDRIAPLRPGDAGLQAVRARIESAARSSR